MAVISGVNGAVFWNEEITHNAAAYSITFTSGTNEIKSTTDGGVAPANIINFQTTGYKKGMLFTLSGATAANNNRTFTLKTVNSGVMIVDEAVISSVSSGLTDLNAITFLEAEPGYEEAGFYNWAVSYKVDIYDATAFDTSSGGRSYIPSITSWTAKADKYFLSTGNSVDEWLGDTVKARFFMNYASTPSGSNIAKYYEGNTIITGIDQGTPVDALITQGISFQGIGALTLATRDTGWSTT